MEPERAPAVGEKTAHLLEHADTVAWGADDGVPVSQDKLARENAFDHDHRIRLDEEHHVYYVDGEIGYVSVSTVLHDFFVQFDPVKTVDMYFAGWVANPESKYHALINYVRLVQGHESAEDQKNAIRMYWSKKGNEASAKGTYFHKQAENYMNSLPMDESLKETEMFRSWLKSFHPEEALSPFRAEISVMHTRARVAGQIDSLWKDKAGRLWMIDWKRCDPTDGKRKRLDLLGPSMNRFRSDDYGLYPFERVPNTKYGHYCVQQNCYKHMFEALTGVKIYKMFLVQIHPCMDAAHSVEVADLSTEVALVFDTLEASEHDGRAVA
tara:strand:+ start:978 stop:1949 length:972 start_codon:yes stop_codon:yes gene_type:complete